MVKLYADVIFIKDWVFEKQKRISKNINEQITIGRGRDNDISLPDNSFISEFHGRLYVHEGVFKGTLNYEDRSLNGSLVTYWEGFELKTMPVNNRVIQIPEHQWIIVSALNMYGVIIIPYVK